MASYPSNTSNNWTLIVDVTNVEVDIPNNRSKVSWAVKLKDVYREIAARCVYHLAINGTNVWVSESGGTTITDRTQNNTTTLASGTTGWIGHDSNGSKSVSISAGIRSNSTTATWRIPQLSISETLTLTTIPRASNFTLSGATQTNADILVTIDRKSTAFSHRVRWRVGSGSWIVVANGATTAASLKVQPSNMPNLKSATITVGVQTYNGATAIGSEATTTRVITIPNSAISVSGTANTGSAQTVSISNSGGSLSHTIGWQLGSTYGAGASWTPPHSALPSAPASGTLWCQVITKNGTATISTIYATRTITVPDSIKPTLTAITHSEAVSDVSSKVGAYVQNKTKLKLGVTGASAGSGSSIKSYSISVAGQTVGNGGTTPNVINQSGTLTITATVTDNRNRTATKTDTITVLAYENPIVTGVSFTRSNVDGTPNTSGTYLKIESTIRVRRLVVGGIEKNKIWYQSQSARVGQSYETKADLENQAGSINGNYLQSVYYYVFNGYPVDYPYNVRVRGGDIFSWSGYIAGGIPTGVVLQHWGEDTTSFGKMIDDVNYNVLVGSKGLRSDGPIQVDGAASSFGKTPTYGSSYNLEIGAKGLRSDGPIQVSGGFNVAYRVDWYLRYSGDTPYNVLKDRFTELNTNIPTIIHIGGGAWGSAFTMYGTKASNSYASFIAFSYASEYIYLYRCNNGVWSDRFK